MEITLEENIENYLKKIFNTDDLSIMISRVISDWAENQIKLNNSSKPIDTIITEDKTLKEIDILNKKIIK